MEGYTNVIGTPYDFDDLDIEGRVVDEWKAEDEEKNRKNVSREKVLPILLRERVKLDNGQSADVFSVTRKQDNEWYTCFLCADTMVGAASLRDHAQSAKHRANMSIPVHPKSKFVKLDPKENMALEPGEPVPPGLEEMFIKNCIIQPKLDACKDTPLIGLEFLLELTDSPLSEPEYYYCQLCEKIGGERNMFIHLTSIFHYMKYLSMYFPTAAKRLHSLPNRKMKKAFGLVVTDIIKDIETKFGRMKPSSETYSNFHAPGRKSELQKIAFAKTHFSEKDGGETFEEKATAENVENKAKELFTAAQVVEKPEPVVTIKSEEKNKQETGSMFNKNRISVDKKQLRPRDEEKANSPDLQVVDVTFPTKNPESKKRTRSRSLSSISSVSSSSSYSRGRRHYLRQQSKLSRSRRWSRSRSRSPSYRNRRRRSPSYGRSRHSPGRRSSRDRSNERKWRSRRDSRGHSPDAYRSRGVDRFGRSREKSSGDKYRRDNLEDEKGSPRHIGSEEKARWEKFREVFKEIESSKLEKLKYYEKNPEKHPQYPEEWKSFWNRRYNELQRSGVDPSKHDFKPEWISFWTKRMKDLYEEDLGQAKDELKKKYNLPDDEQQLKDAHAPWKRNQRRRSPGLEAVSPPTPEKKDVIADIKSTWKAFTGSDIKDAPKRPLSPWEDDGPPSRRDTRRLSRSRSHSPLNMNEKLLEDMPQRKSKTSSLIFVLRKLTVLEEQLGSLAPRVFELMQQSLAYEKIKEEASLDLLMESDNAFFLETTREKLIALLCAGVVPRNFVNTARSAIKHIDIALYLATKRERTLPPGALRSTVGLLPAHGIPAHSPYVEPPRLEPVVRSEPVVVPGIGQVDKVAIAQQIASALVEQGKTNVTEAELEQLINAVVGMAEASVNSSQPMTTAGFLNQLQAMQKQIPVQSVQPVPPVNEPSGNVSNIPIDVAPPNPPANFGGALKLLQSAYNEPSKIDLESPKSDFIKVSSPKPSTISDEELAAMLMKFNQTKKEDQSSFLQNLKSSNPDMYKRLCPFISSSNISAVSEPIKRSPISISVPKNRSEQKIKPLSSGRLSPFSSRSGGANPTVNEGIVLDDEDDFKDDVKLIGEVSRPKTDDGNGQISTFKINSVELDDEDDDDDDYSYEDVYKAAQEKLRQNQLAEDHESTQSTTKSASEVLVSNDKMKRGSQINVDKTKLSNELKETIPLSFNNQERGKVVYNDSYQSQRLVEGDNSKPQYVHKQPTQQPDYDNFDIASNIPQGNPYQSTNVINPPTASYTYQTPQQRSQFPDTSQYQNNSMYSKPNNDYYDRNIPYPEETPNRLYSGGASYSAGQSYDQSSEMYNNPYRTETNTSYDNYSGSYSDQYNSYQQPQPPPPRGYPNQPLRYPNYSQY